MIDIKTIGAKLGLTLKQASPEILIGGGLILGLAAMIVACSKMKETEEVKEDLQEEIEVVRDSEVEGTKEYVLGHVKAGGKAVLRYLKIFWIPILLEIMSICAIWYSHGMMVKRNTYLTSAAVALTQQLENYRGRVRNKIGEEAENDLYYNLTPTKIEETVVDENGKEKKTKVTKKVMENGLENPWDRVLDSSNRNYGSTPGSLTAFLRMSMETLERTMKMRATDHSNGWLRLNEVYDFLGMERTELGEQYGWIYSRFDPRYMETHLDFGLSDMSNQIVKQFMDGLQPVIPLHFNCYPLNLKDLNFIKF